MEWLNCFSDRLSRCVEEAQIWKGEPSRRGGFWELDSDLSLKVEFVAELMPMSSTSDELISNQ